MSDQAKLSAQPRSLYARAIDHEIDTAAAFEQLFAGERYAFWLDSPPGSGGRYSLLGSAHHLLTGGFDRLERAMQQAPPLPSDLPSGIPPDLVPGWVGFFAYEPDSSIWMVPDRFLVVDHHDGRSWAVAADDPRWPSHAACRAAPPTGSPPSGDLHTAVGEGQLEPWLLRGRDRYLADIETCLCYLRAGESYEICLTNTVATPYLADAEDPLLAYLRLRSLNPAPYAAFLKLGNRFVLSASPERFLTVQADGTVESRPIKGTAARSADPEEDTARAKALRAEEKTRAENLMIVDLVRNDLGRVCRPGSIEVPSFLAVESYATVHQLVSTVRGRLRPDVGAVRAAEACFPPGSMTGAPKQRTMEIIDELERRPRGVYSGALGWFGLDGTADLGVVIRTAEIDRGPGTVVVGAGGAIVLDSDPEQEYAEMLLKAAVPFRAVRPGTFGHRGAGARTDS